MKIFNKINLQILWISYQKWPIRGIRRTSRSPNQRHSSLDNVSMSSAPKSIASKIQVHNKNFSLIWLRFKNHIKSFYPLTHQIAHMISLHYLFPHHWLIFLWLRCELFHNILISSHLSQDSKRFGSSVNGKSMVANENKDTGYSSSSSSSNGATKLSSLNCQNCTVLCDELKPSSVGSFCLSCFHHWR